MLQYLGTLPSECPMNLAARSENDLALAQLSLQAWKVDLLEAEKQMMHVAAAVEGLAPWSAEEVRWATCMKLSRAYAGVGSGPVMIPFVDMVNHAHGQKATCIERGEWHDKEAGVWAAKLVTRRDLEPGDEITYEYQETPSRARMLSSFGFGDGVPSATLAASGLPERDAAWLAEHGCEAGRLRTELWLQALDETELIRDGRTRLSDAALREAVRCMRLSLYEPEEAEWALRNGHLFAPWGGWAEQDMSNAADLDVFRAILMKDHRIVSNTASLCADVLLTDVEFFEGRLAAASADLADAIGEEVTALAACAEGFSEAERLLGLRLGGSMNTARILESLL